MPAESYNLVTGHLQWGYACSHCGDACNMLATGHGPGECPDRRSEFKYKYDGTPLEKPDDEHILDTQ